MDEKRKEFLELKSMSGEDAVKTAETTTKDFDYDRHLVDKALAGFERINSHYERSSVGKNVLNNTARYREIICERESRFLQPIHHCLILRNCHCHPNLQQAPPLLISSHQHSGKKITTF